MQSTSTATAAAAAVLMLRATHCAAQDKASASDEWPTDAPPRLVDNANIRVDHPMGQGSAGLADGDSLVYFCGGRNSTHMFGGCNVFSPGNCLASKSPCR